MDLLKPSAWSQKSQNPVFLRVFGFSLGFPESEAPRYSDFVDIKQHGAGFKEGSGGLMSV